MLFLLEGKGIKINTCLEKIIKRHKIEFLILSDCVENKYYVSGVLKDGKFTYSKELKKLEVEISNHTFICTFYKLEHYLWVSELSWSVNCSHGLVLNKKQKKFFWKDTWLR